ncbi:glycosyltransferase family 2 protein [Candidatus Beckwithbacteria bacterium]|nr:glycosyltransferase family 2 protein [Candidatus Beckwithbacteria bacterium]
MFISIIIPTYNGKMILSKYLPLILKGMNKNTEILIVDNNSTDGTNDLINSFKTVKYLKLNKNYGFSGACNSGAKKALGEYLLFLNNDCLLDSQNLNKLVKFLESNNNLVATQPVVLNPQREIENIGLKVNLRIAKAFPIKNKIWFKNFKKKQTNPFKISEIYVLAATCLLIRRNIFTKIGMFDEKFHSYHEDVDLFIRLTKAGYSYLPCLDASCIHEHMATSIRMSNYKQKQDFKNWIRIIIKNYPLSYKVKYSPSLLVERLRNLNGIIKTYL